MGLDAERFLQPVVNYLECVVCYEVLLQPVEVCSEAHSICTGCYAEIAKMRNPQCPSCRRAIKEVRPSKTLSRIIDALEMKCTNDGRGCAWTGPFGNLEDHGKTCEHRFHPCPNDRRGCGFKALPEDLDKHLDLCPFHKISCPYGCEVSYLRKRSYRHEKVCSRVPCSVRPDCETRGTRTEIEQHAPLCRALLDAEELRTKYETEVKKREAAELEIRKVKAEVVKANAEVAKAKAEAAKMQAELVKQKTNLTAAARLTPIRQLQPLQPNEGGSAAEKAKMEGGSAGGKRSWWLIG